MTEPTTINALSKAIEDEYRARATYRKVIERFGPVRPFVNIVEAENRHVEALLRQFARLRVEPTADTWPDRVSAPASLAETCAAGVKAEIENDALYARLLNQVSDPQVLFSARNVKRQDWRSFLCWWRCQGYIWS